MLKINLRVPNSSALIWAKFIQLTCAKYFWCKFNSMLRRFANVTFGQRVVFISDNSEMLCLASMAIHQSDVILLWQFTNVMFCQLNEQWIQKSVRWWCSIWIYRHKHPVVCGDCNHEFCQSATRIFVIRRRPSMTNKMKSQIGTIVKIRNVIIAA